MRRLTNPIRRLLSRLGVHVMTSGTRDRMLRKQPRYSTLNMLEGVRTVIDIGVGDQGSPFLYRAFPDAFFVSIDPVAETEAAVNRYLSDRQGAFINVAVGATGGEIEFEVSAKPSRSSTRQRRVETDKTRAVSQRRVAVKTLDDILAPFQLEPRILLKIDVEGGELDCLAGAAATLRRHCDYVVLELPLLRNFEDDYGFSDAITLMAGSGFEVLQILNYTQGNCDVLFCRQDDPLRERAAWVARTQALENS